ncbi:transposase [Tenacibaculum sp.]|uniref:transposase n=1 Tax=Tenacibaculum sp. TaxID=1906242 RepID=UPI003D1532FB
MKHLAGYVGQATGVYQNGSNSKTMGITPRVHRLIRSYFIEASWQTIRTDPMMQNCYRKHYGKDTKKDYNESSQKAIIQNTGSNKNRTTILR